MPTDPEYAARRRAVIRRNHPDVGGDPEVLHAELARLDREFADKRPAPRRAPSADVFVVKPTPAWKVMRRKAFYTVGRVRSRLPRVVGGSRRFYDI